MCNLQKLSKMFVGCSRAATLDIMARYNTTTAADLKPPDSKTFSFLCQDQQVKVDSNIYHMDRLKSSLQSNYFEKLFTSDEFKQKTDKILEIQPKNSELFPTIVDLLHEKNLLDVLNKDNYIPLLESMDSLEMNIDLEIVSKFIDQNLSLLSLEDAKLFELYRFIRKNSKFEYLSSSVLKIMSGHLRTVRNHEICKSLSLGHLIQIISKVRNLDDEKRYEIVQMCAEWLSHDLENRLPHIVVLVNSIKPDFHLGRKSDESKNKLGKRLPKIDIDKEAKRKITANYVFSLLAYGGNLNPTILDKETLASGYETDYDYNYTEESDYEVYEENDCPSSSISWNSRYDKLEKFLKNHDFYDITVRVGGKAYKLHRSILESKCSYFANIFRTEYAEAVAASDGTLPITCPSKDKEYLIDDRIASSVFDDIIDYIYLYRYIRFEKYVVKSFFDKTIDIFKAADILGIENLLEGCLNWLKQEPKQISSEDKIEVLNFTHGRSKYDDLHSIYLSKHLADRWPEIYDVSKFCSISWPVLEITLKSPSFRFDDPNKILDVCSTWIIHDVKNRYSLLPEISKAINPACLPNCEKYSANDGAPNDCSPESVRDELWEILSSVEYLTSQSLPETSPGKLEDIPVFVTMDYEQNNIDILNANLDKITPSGFSGFLDKSTWGGWHTSHMWTTMNGDNLFLFFSSYDYVSFHVYNFRLKKRFTLISDYRLETRIKECTLLNCNNDIYFCSKDGSVMAKYSTHLNRWAIMPQQSQHNESQKFQFVSDGNNLFRICEISENDYRADYIIEMYDLEKKLWARVSDLPPIKNVIKDPIQLTVINDGDLAVSFFTTVVIFDRNSKTSTWRYCRLPEELWTFRSTFIQLEDCRFLFKKDSTLYHISLSKENDWNFRIDSKIDLKDKLSKDAVIHWMN